MVTGFLHSNPPLRCFGTIDHSVRITVFLKSRKYIICTYKVRHQKRRDEIRRETRAAVFSASLFHAPSFGYLSFKLQISQPKRAIKKFPTTNLKPYVWSTQFNEDFLNPSISRHHTWPRTSYPFLSYLRIVDTSVHALHGVGFFRN